MSQEWDYPPRPRRHYARLDFDVAPNAPTRPSGWVIAGKIGWTFTKVVIAIPLTALILAAVWFLCVLLSLPGHSEPLYYGHMQPARTETAGPSFNCNYARSPDEIAICQSPTLSQADIVMAATYFSIHSKVHGELRRRLEISQGLWLADRSGCGDNLACLSRLYDYRIDEFARGDYIYGD